MPSPIHVRQKTVQDRDVISIRKEYAGETHEVYVPTEDTTQLLLNLLGVINDGKADDRKFVLARKGTVGENTDSLGDDLIKKTTVKAIVRELYDDDTANAVVTLLNGEAND